MVGSRCPSGYFVGHPSIGPIGLSIRPHSGREVAARTYQICVPHYPKSYLVLRCPAAKTASNMQLAQCRNGLFRIGFAGSWLIFTVAIGVVSLCAMFLWIVAISTASAVTLAIRIFDIGLRRAKST